MRQARSINTWPWLWPLCALGLALCGCDRTLERPAHAAAPPLPPKALAIEPERPAGPPLSLTASDGSGLEIVSLKARAVVLDPLAFTELQIVFHNPRPRAIEGQFTITLPEGAAISRFAMRQDNGWQEGEVVELQAAREAYEDFLHRRQDPALLEKQAGNLFSARVFPIPASGDKELIISYSQERPRSADPYRIFLRGLPKLRALDLRAVVSQSAVQSGGSSLGGTTLQTQVVEVKKQDFAPDQDFLVPLQTQAASGLRHENLVVARVTPIAEDRPDPVSGLTILFDTSASRALGFQEEAERLGQLVAALRQGHDKLPLRVLLFDQEVVEAFHGAARDFGPKEIARIVERRALGASDLGQALKALMDKGRASPRVLLVTDGIATAGATEGNDLRKLVKALGGAGVKRLDALVLGGIRDEALLGKLVTAGLSADGVVADGDLPVAAVAARLQRATFSGIQVAVPGAAWVWPAQLDGVQPGDQVLVYADLPKDQPFSVVLKGAQEVRQQVALAEVPRPLLERAWIGARIRKLMHQRDTLAESDNDLREGLRHQIVDLSTKFRVLSDYTALLVLETEADYARFHIDRRALADILTVGPSGIETLDRRRQQPVFVAQPPPQPVWRDGDPLAGAPMEAAKSEVARERPSGGKAAKKAANMDRGGGFAPSRNRAEEAPPPPRSAAPGGPAQGAGGAATAMAPSPQPVAAAPMAPPPPPAMAARQMAAPRPAPPSPARHALRRAAATDAMDALLDGASGSQGALMIARPQEEKQPEIAPYEGTLLQVMNLLKAGKKGEAQAAAAKWHDGDPGDVLGLIALGEVFEAMGQKAAAARAYGSIIDLFPGRADLRRFAGERLERLADSGLPLATDTFTKAEAQRADHPASHRLLAYALLRAGKYAEAMAAIERGMQQQYPPGRFAGVDRILNEDAGLIAAAWLRKEPNQKNAILERLHKDGAALPERPSLRFVLNWETDANDVDFHIHDGHGGHAFYSSRVLPSGGELYADVTTGYGPECFTIEGKPHAYPYKLQAHYYSRGPMGYGMGKLEIIEHDGHGGLRFAERPFVIMVDHAFVDLGQVTGPL